MGDEQKPEPQWVEGRGDPTTRNVYLRIGNQVVVTDIAGALSLVREANKAIAEAAVC